MVCTTFRALRPARCASLRARAAVSGNYSGALRKAPAIARLATAGVSDCGSVDHGAMRTAEDVPG
jgi:hypothetical protein